MPRYGIEVSQEGIPIKRAADYQKSLDDRWPFLDIPFEQEFRFSKIDFPTATGYWTQELLSHDLGYLPAFQYREIVADSNLTLFTGDIQIVATKTKIYARALWQSGTPMTRLNMQGLLRVFAVDITKEFKNPIDAITPRTRVSAKKYGVKILRPDRPTARINDTEMSNFSLNSNAKVLSIQQTGVAVAESPDYLLEIEHNMGYPPTYMIAPLDAFATRIIANPDPFSGIDVIYPVNQMVLGKTTADTSSLTVEGAQAALEGSYAYLILKDPAEVAA